MVGIPVLVPAVSPEAAPAEKVPSAADVRQLLMDKSFDRALVASTAVLEREPSNREIRKLVLESAVLSRKFDVGVRPNLGPGALSRGKRTGRCFYASVCLFETGSLEEPGVWRKKAVPRVVSTPYVEYYKKKILE